MSPRIAWALACVVGLLAAEAPQPLRAQGVTGMSNVTTANGLALTIDSHWPGGHGYRPVRIEVSSLAPSVADRTLTVDLRCHTLYGGTGSIVVGQDIEIPAGAAQVVETIAVPEQFAVGVVELDVALNGRHSKGLSISNTGGWSNYGQGIEEHVPAILLVHGGTPETYVFSNLFPEIQTFRQWSQPPAVSGEKTPYPFALTTPAVRLPERFVDYSALDIVCLSLNDAVDLAAKRPAAWTAVRRWTAAGGNLWVYGMGDDWQRLAELEHLLDCPPAQADRIDPAARGWTLPDKNDLSDAVRGRDNFTGVNSYPTTVATVVSPAVSPDGAEQAKKTDEPKPRVPDRPHFVSRRLAAGLVVALAPEDPFPGTAHEWGWVLNHVGVNRFLWARRHGLSLRSENASFWDWMIPGVGLAPVGAFRALITVFVLFIGPVNYYWLRRRGKLHLLLLSIPLCALLVTGSLFGYGIIADGLGVRIRMRSYTEIDQRRGEAICWSRNSYYASLAPSGGLTMPEDVVVLPLAAMPHYQDGQNHVRRAMDWTAEGQKLHTGWLSARTLTQYLLVRSRASDRGLKLLHSSPAGDTWTIENNLGTRIQRLLVIGEDGRAFRAGDSPDGGAAKLSSADLRAELQGLKQYIDAARGVIPEGVPIEVLKAAASGRRGWASYYPTSQGLTDVSSHTGRLETSLVESTAMKPEGNGVPVEPVIPLFLGPRSYVAIVDRSPEAPTGVPVVREEGSLHVIVGRW